MVVPSPPFSSPARRPEMEPLGKESLRRAALDARKAFVRTLSRRRARPARAAARPASHLALRRSHGRRRLCSDRDRRSARCWPPRKRARSARSSPFPRSTIPPSRSASAPAIRWSRPVRDDAAQASASGGRARPDPRSADRDRRPAARGSAAARAITIARWRGCRKSGARLVGIGWAPQRLTETIPRRRLGRSARRLRLARRDRALRPGGVKLRSGKA